MPDASKDDLCQLVQDLGSEDTGTRVRARDALIERGSKAVPALLRALDAPERQTRWEAAKSLAEIRDPASANRLAAALGDQDVDVRWIVAEALIALERDAVAPLLRLMLTKDLPPGTYEGAHHVARELVTQSDLREALGPILEALDGPEPDVTAPVAAAKVLDTWRV